ncbi:MAG TPA: MBOAT family protein [Candidatus Blautia pullicola]|jgi:alginate O-acetyltransferase complex protein AlgI|uniref:MBOAT family protein n=1 Tax=Candidatus Blautia pullicola TaxID=2838498 RepID=A0A9D2FQJ6_9FIRM|nr:MBOAT family protein [Candidatus Blautia pullicola]
MIFSSIFFLFVFLPVTLVLYYLVPWKLKNFILLLCSLVFYAWGEPVYVFLMLFSIIFNFISGIEIQRYQELEQTKLLRFSFWFTVAVNLGILGFFKYYGFLIGNLNAILPFDIPYRDLPLPIGISFYTFQTLSYIIDVYWGRVPVQKNFIKFGTYVTMFPQLIAGPIVRYADVDMQLSKRSLNLYKFGQGVSWFLRGLGKKVLLANNIGMTFDAILALAPGERSVITAWVGCIAYAMQIYFDFSGYSDMAVGLGKMLGFEFVKNFDYPYISKSVTEFWRRWHISLGTWFREYVYIPLGGNRVSVLKHVRNILIVWMLTGFWHGAAWNFMLWGLYYGLLLLLEKYFLADKLKRLPGKISQLYAFVLVLFGWVLFFSPTLIDAIRYMGNMLGIGGSGFLDSTGLYYLAGSFILLVICFLCSTPWVWKKFRRFALQKGSYPSIAAAVIYTAIFIFSIAYLVNATYNPFLYFRF